MNNVDQGVPAWLVMLLAFPALVGAVMATLSYFATRREMDDARARLAKVEDARAPDRFVNREEFLSLVSRNAVEHDNIFKKLGGIERGAKEHTDRALAKVQEDIKEVSNKVASVETKTDQQNAWLERMDEKLDRISQKG